MKTAYELAMERLEKNAPQVKITDAQRKELAEIDSVYAAKLAERELIVKAELAKAQAAEQWETVEQLEKQLASDRKTLAAEREEKKERVRKQQT